MSKPTTTEKILEKLDEREKALDLLEEVARNDVISFNLAEKIEDFLRETGRW